MLLVLQHNNVLRYIVSFNGYIEVEIFNLVQCKDIFNVEWLFISRLNVTVIKCFFKLYIINNDSKIQLMAKSSYMYKIVFGIDILMDLLLLNIKEFDREDQTMKPVGSLLE